MKVFVFMYPYSGYFLDAVEGLEPAMEHGLLTRVDMHGINRLIESRYRAEGYQIVWVFYGKKGALHDPVIESVSPFLNYQNHDTFISSGTQGKHPNCEFIINLLPSGIDHLVVGGFHWQFCPRELAEYADSLGIQSVVDEDTTQAYFLKILFHRLSEGEMAEYPKEGIEFVPFMGEGTLEGQVALYRKLERWPFLARKWNQNEYSLRDESGILRMPKEAFRCLFF